MFRLKQHQFWAYDPCGKLRRHSVLRAVKISLYNQYRRHLVSRLRAGGRRDRQCILVPDYAHVTASWFPKSHFAVVSLVPQLSRRMSLTSPNPAPRGPGSIKPFPNKSRPQVRAGAEHTMGDRHGDPWNSRNVPDLGTRPKITLQKHLPYPNLGPKRAWVFMESRVYRRASKICGACLKSDVYSWSPTWELEG